MAYENLSGTTKKSFKFGPNGVALSSEAVKSGEKNAKKYLISNQKNDAGTDFLRVAYEDPNEPIYDTFIKSSDISSISYGNNVIMFHLRDGSQITINKNMTGDVKGPDSATPDAIALFDGDSGKVIKDSGKVMSDEVTDDSSQIPTSAAVIKYVGKVETPLRERLEGTLPGDIDY